MKQLMAGGGIILLGTTLIPLLSGLPVGEKAVLELVALRLLCAVAQPYTCLLYTSRCV